MCVCVFCVVGFCSTASHMLMMRSFPFSMFQTKPDELIHLFVDHQPQFEEFLETVEACTCFLDSHALFVEIHRVYSWSAQF